MQLYIIRHAQSSNNALADERDRVCDPLLTELGKRQAEILADHLAYGTPLEAIGGDGAGKPGTGYGLARLLCSSMRRSLQTAQPIARATGLQVEVLIDIHECGGIYLDQGGDIGRVGLGGITRSELAREFPGYLTPDEITEEGWWSGGWESDEAAFHRAHRVANLLRGWAERQERVALITHGGFSHLLLQALTGNLGSEQYFYHHNNTGISLVTLEPGQRVDIRYLNRVHHIPPELLS